MRLVLDEHLDRTMAVELRRRGHDVVAVTEDPSLEGLKDHEILKWATEQRRVIVTYDAAGFRPLVDAQLAIGEAVAGVIALSAKRYPQRPPSYGALLRDLARVLDEHPEPDALMGRWRWLGSE